MEETRNNGLTGQSHALGALWGNLKLVAQHANIYIQLMILGFSGISAYAVIGAYLRNSMEIELRFWQFGLTTMLIIVSVTFFEWRFGLPSSFISWNRQWWEHRNPMRDQLDEMYREIKEMKEMLSTMERPQQ